ncbi:Lrp/AsnC family transcriptional regulator [Sporomusa sphaeroides]|uniref:Lrp/AsnC family transcriptional regulator n=1 Tax=Sporomusa sphaeroides TaxID=47679 RepID=UPI00202F2B2A|nr:Lrp/AsnC family transcriptional regulator [Sporomusa sphaeroides]MCM0758404.1 Lrp/AsnC family transcriptional regulator [Sporomusa sphaeroides DSM 2875]HML34903.1 Lrp/AsnC family transcriptional regulator [Sporomusa sphaeroides]
MSAKEHRLDKIDDAIIRILSHDGRISMKELGEKIHLSGQAAKNRVEQLEDMGIIQRYTINMNCPVYGYKVHALIQLTIQLSSKTAFSSFIQNCESPILHCYQITGENAYVIDSHFRSIEELQSFMEKLEKYGTCKVNIILQDMILKQK